MAAYFEDQLHIELQVIFVFRCNRFMRYFISPSGLGVILSYFHRTLNKIVINVTLTVTYLFSAGHKGVQSYFIFCFFFILYNVWFDS